MSITINSINVPQFISFYFSLNNIFPKPNNLKTIAIKMNWLDNQTDSGFYNFLV